MDKGIPPVWPHKPVRFCASTVDSHGLQIIGLVNLQAKFPAHCYLSLAILLNLVLR